MSGHNPRREASAEMPTGTQDLVIMNIRTFAVKPNRPDYAAARGTDRGCETPLLGE
jgi:hypothetical protein